LSWNSHRIRKFGDHGHWLQNGSGAKCCGASAQTSVDRPGTSRNETNQRIHNSLRATVIVVERQRAELRLASQALLSCSMFLSDLHGHALGLAMPRAICVARETVAMLIEE
jgi:hypothetical protein